MRISSRSGRKAILIAVTLFSILTAGAALAITGAGGTMQQAPTGINLFTEFGDYGLGYATTGASQVKGDGSAQSTNCSTSNTTASSAQLTVPAGATKVRSYLYWLGLEQHPARGYPSLQTINSEVKFTPAGGQAITVKGTRRMEVNGTRQSQVIRYGAYQADVTSLLPSTMSGTYSVEIAGGIPNLCALWGENARAWQLVTVYDTPGLNFSKVYIYDGVDYLYGTTRTIGISGYIAPAVGPASSLTAFVAQGDAAIAGEYATTSDASFPDFPTNFADSTVNASTQAANGKAVDIDTLTGQLTPGSTGMTVTFGTNNDVIVPSTFVLQVSSLYVPPNSATVTATPTTTTVTPTTTTVAPTSTTVAPTTTMPPTTTAITAAPTTTTTTTVPATTTTTVVVAPVTATPTTTTTTTTVGPAAPTTQPDRMRLT